MGSSPPLPHHSWEDGREIVFSGEEEMCQSLTEEDQASESDDEEDDTEREDTQADSIVSPAEWDSDERTWKDSGQGSSPRRREEDLSIETKLAKAVYRYRFFFVVFWPSVTIASVFPAYLVLPRASDMGHHAPRNSPSGEAMGVFEEHFPDLSTVRRDMVEIRCRAQCESAANDLSRGFVEWLTDIIRRFDARHPGFIVDVNSYYTFSGHHQLGENPMMSRDRQSILLQWIWHVPDTEATTAFELLGQVRSTIQEINTYQGAEGLELSMTGLVSLDLAMKETLFEETVVHEMLTIWMPITILALSIRKLGLLVLALISMSFFIFVSLAILYFISLFTNVFLYGVMLLLMVGTALSFDYSLFTLRRFIEERLAGKTTEEAIVIVIAQSGRVILVSGWVLVIAWSSMLALPNVFRSFAVAISITVIVCVLVQITFVPCVVAVAPWLGGTLNSKNTRPKAEPRNAKEKAKPHMKGFAFTLGKWITRFPFNIIAIVLIVTLMTPLTLRFLKNFDLSRFRFRMGHSYRLQIPREREEWATALRVQQDYPNEVGIMMPMLILATGSGADGPFRVGEPSVADTGTSAHRALGATEPIFRAGRSHAAVPNATSGNRTDHERQSEDEGDRMAPTRVHSAADRSAPPLSPRGPTTLASTSPVPLPRLPQYLPPSTPAPITGTVPPLVPTQAGAPPDVQSQNFWNANCHMANEIIRATQGGSCALGPTSFVSPTFHGEDTENPGQVKCLQSWQILMVKDNYYMRNIFLAHTSSNLRHLWNQTVDQKGHAMITFVFPLVDPFSPEAFNLLEDVRRVLSAENVAAQQDGAAVPGLTYRTFSPGSVLSDLIDVTSESLPHGFLLCVSLSLLSVGIWFGSAIIPFKLLCTLLLPITWTFGASLFVYEDGVLSSLGWTSVMPTGDAGLDWTVPMFTLNFLFGLAIDYEIFLIERVLEFRQEGFGDRESIQLGLAATAETITAAGFIMATTFSGQLLGTIPLTGQMGFVTSFACLVDTLLVRTMLVPAMLSLGTSWHYWPWKPPEARYQWLDNCCDGRTKSGSPSNSYTRGGSHRWISTRDE